MDVTRFLLTQITVEPILFFFMLTTFIQMTAFQDLILTKICATRQKNNHDISNCTSEFFSDSIRNEGSHWILYSNIALTIPAILSTLYLGSWCRHVGCRLPLILPIVGNVVSSLVNIALSIKIDSALAFLLVGQFVSGSLGASVCVIMACNAYVALTSSTNNRTAHLGVLESMIFLGGTIGPFLGGQILNKFGHAAVFAFILSVSVVLLLYTAFRIKNVRPSNEECREMTFKDLLDVEHWSDIVCTCFRPREENKRFFLLLLLFTAFIVMICTAGEMDTAYLFVKGEPLGWDFARYSYYFGVKHCLAGLSLLIGIPLLRRFVEPKDTTVAATGIASKIAGFLMLAFSNTTALMYTVAVFAMFSAFPIPAIRSMLSKLVEPTEHGKLFAFMGALEQICFLLGSVFFNGFYPILSRYLFRGSLFVFGAVLLLLPLSLVGWIHFRRSSFSTSTEYQTLKDDSTPTA